MTALHQHLFHALAAEHQQRTGHNYAREWVSAAVCDVCIHLHAVDRELALERERAEGGAR